MGRGRGLTAPATQPSGWKLDVSAVLCYDPTPTTMPNPTPHPIMCCTSFRTTHHTFSPLPQLSYAQVVRNAGQRSCVLLDLASGKREQAKMLPGLLHGAEEGAVACAQACARLRNKCFPPPFSCHSSSPGSLSASCQHAVPIATPSTLCTHPQPRPPQCTQEGGGGNGSSSPRPQAARSLPASCPPVRLLAAQCRLLCCHLGKAAGSASRGAQPCLPPAPPAAAVRC